MNRPVPFDTSRPEPPRRLVRGSQQLGHLLGKRLLVGLTTLDEHGSVVERSQFCGRVLEVADGVVVVENPGQDPVVLPADVDAYDIAPAGTYALRATDSVVVDPDYLCRWSVTESPG